MLTNTKRLLGSKGASSKSLQSTGAWEVPIYGTTNKTPPLILQTPKRMRWRQAYQTVSSFVEPTNPEALT